MLCDVCLMALLSRVTVVGRPKWWEGAAGRAWGSFEARLARLKRGKTCWSLQRGRRRCNSSSRNAIQLLSVGKNKKDGVIARLRGTGEKGLVVVLAEAYLYLCARICLPASAGLCSLIAGGKWQTFPPHCSSFVFIPSCAWWLYRAGCGGLWCLVDKDSTTQDSILVQRSQFSSFFFAVDVLSQMCGGDVLTVISRRFRDGESFATTSFLLAAMWRRVCSVPYLAWRLWIMPPTPSPSFFCPAIFTVIYTVRFDIGRPTLLLFFNYKFYNALCYARRCNSVSCDNFVFLVSTWANSAKKKSIKWLLLSN